MYFLLFYETVENYVARRAPFREAHLAHANKYREEGLLVMAGALANPADGAVLVFKADSPDIPKRFAEEDPYVKQGLITKWTVREWSVVVQ